MFIAPVILQESRRDCNLLMVAVCWHRAGLVCVGGREIVSAGICRRSYRTSVALIASRKTCWQSDRIGETVPWTSLYQGYSNHHTPGTNPQLSSCCSSSSQLWVLFVSLLIVNVVVVLVALLFIINFILWGWNCRIVGTHTVVSLFTGCRNYILSWRIKKKGRAKKLPKSPSFFFFIHRNAKQSQSNQHHQQHQQQQTNKQQTIATAQLDWIQIRLDSTVSSITVV